MVVRQLFLCIRESVFSGESTFQVKVPFEPARSDEGFEGRRV